MKNIEEWGVKVRKFNSELNKYLMNNSNKKELYYGFEVFDGKFFKEPNFLFIEINPGKRNSKKGRNIFETEQISYLDDFERHFRIDFKNKYHLADKTMKYFFRTVWCDEKIKKIFFEEVVKTNFYHLATDDVQDLNSVLLDVNYEKEYSNKSAEFLIQLINLSKPKIVLIKSKKYLN